MSMTEEQLNLFRKLMPDDAIAQHIGRKSEQVEVEIDAAEVAKAEQAARENWLESASPGLFKNLPADPMKACDDYNRTNYDLKAVQSTRHLGPGSKEDQLKNKLATGLRGLLDHMDGRGSSDTPAEQDTGTTE